MPRASRLKLSMPCCSESSPGFSSDDCSAHRGGESSSSILDRFDEHLEGYAWYEESYLIGGSEEIKEFGERHSKATGFGFLVTEYPDVDEIIQATHVINGKHVSIRRTIFVGNLSRTVTADKFKRFFSKFGKVVEYEVIHHEGIGFVIFDSDQVVDGLLAKQRIKFAGRKVEIKNATIERSCIVPLGFGDSCDRYGVPSSYRTSGDLGRPHLSPSSCSISRDLDRSRISPSSCSISRDLGRSRISPSSHSISRDLGRPPSGISRDHGQIIV